MKKLAFFDQKHGLTPLEKCDFWEFERLNFIWPKKVSYLSRTLLNIFSTVISTKNKLIKKVYFLAKSMG